ncbi:MAG: hypothetical protein IJ400_07165 [Clostridia bacterium]|nr:hypothetical protein [Clostridia bacterium]
MKKSIKIIALLTIIALAFTLASCDLKGTIEQYSQNIYNVIMSNQGYLKEDEQYKTDTPSTENEQAPEDYTLTEDENA